MSLGVIPGLIPGLTGSRAEAYVRYLSEQGQPYYWSVSCVPVSIHMNQFSGMSANEVAKSVAGAAHTWSPDEVACGTGTSVTHPYLEIVPSLSLDPAADPPIGYDARNVIVFRTDNWNKGGKPSARAYAPQALAITSVFASRDGHILDADIEINALNFSWANLDSGLPGGNAFDTYDLQTTLTHEFGHLIGFDHTCFTPSLDPTMPKARPTDDLGRDVPDCDSAVTEEVRSTVMFDQADPASIAKRVLTDDDRRGVCEVYQAALDPQVCSLDAPNDGCALAAPALRGGRRGAGSGSGSSITALLVAACVLGVVLARARRRNG